MSLLFNKLSRFLIAFLPRSKCLLNLWLQSPFVVILEAKKIKSVTASIFSPSIFCEVMEPDTMILIFWVSSFKPAFSLSSFTLIKRLFSSSSLSAIKVISSAYLRLLIFFLAMLILAFESSSPAFHMMYSAYRGFPGGASGKEPTCQYQKHRDASSIPGVRKIPWKRACQRTPVSWPG